jgi:hypothetical protein
MSAGPRHDVLDSDTRICSFFFYPTSLLTKVRHVLHAGQSAERVPS